MNFYTVCHCVTCIPFYYTPPSSLTHEENHIQEERQRKKDPKRVGEKERSQKV
jgi:hypothetical protein